MKFIIMLAILTLPLALLAQTKTIVLSKNNTIIFNDEVSGQSTADAIKAAKKIKNPRGPLYLFIFSPGGEIQSGMEFIEELKGLGQRVDTITMFAASMSFQIVENLGNRYILDSGILMSHHAAGGVQGEFGGAQPAQLNNRLGLWEQRILEMDKQTVARTHGKQTIASYQKAYDHELWLTGQDAVAQGYADAVVRVSCDASLSGYTTKYASVMGLRLAYDVSDCPLNTSPVNVRVMVGSTKGTFELQDFYTLGGSFGSDCYTLAATNPNKVCAVDTSLTQDKIDSITAKFLDHWKNISDYVVPMQAK